MYDPQRAELENVSLRSRNYVFDVDRVENRGGDYNSYDLLDVMPAEVPKSILDTITAYLDTEGSKLGYTQNMNDKKERLTTGENYKDLHGISNVQFLMLTWLKSFGRRFKNKYPNIDLDFGLSNQSDALGVPYMGEELDVDNETNDEDKELNQKVDE